MSKRDISKSFLIYGRSINDKNQKEAIRCYSFSIKNDPTNFLSYFFRAKLKQFYFKKMYAALIDYNKVIIIKPDFIESYIFRGKLFVYLKNFQRGLDDFKTIISIDKKNSNGYFLISTTYSNHLKNYRKALFNLTRAISFAKPQNKSQYYFYRGYLFETKFKHLNLALSDYTHAINLGFKDLDVFQRRALLNFKLKKYPESIKDYTFVITNFVEYSSNIFLHRANSYIVCNEFKKAIEDVDTYIKFNPKKYNGYMFRGRLFETNKFYDLALFDYDMALKYNCSNEKIIKRIKKLTFKLTDERFYENVFIFPNKN